MYLFCSVEGIKKGLSHEHSCGMAQYKSNDWLIEGLFIFEWMVKAHKYWSLEGSKNGFLF